MTEIVQASPREIETIQALWSEYWESFGLSGDFQGFEDERRSLPGKYAAPGGRLLLALVDREAAGTAALRPLHGNACEAKRLYVRRQYRGFGLGKALLERLVEEARVAGYREMYGDTLQSMEQALEMYYRFGFVIADAYSANPTPGGIFLRLKL